jgi:hypothetical protein
MKEFEHILVPPVARGLSRKALKYTCSRLCTASEENEAQGEPGAGRPAGRHHRQRTTQ